LIAQGYVPNLMQICLF